MSHLASFAPCDPGFFGGKFVCGTFLVGRLTALAGDDPLFGCVHTGEASTFFL
jgi:hypothetical protein